MTAIIQGLAPLQIILLPATLALLAWSIWLTIFKKDKPMGIVLYIGVVIIVDVYMEAILPLSALVDVSYGSIRYSDILILFLLFMDGPHRRQDVNTDNPLRRKVIILLSMMMLLFVYAALRGDTLGNGFREFRIGMLKPFLCVYVISTGFQDRNDYKKLVLYLIVLSALFSVASIELKFFDRLFLKGLTYDKDLFWAPIRREGRYGGFILNPNNMGNFCVMLLPVLLAGLAVWKKMWGRLAVFGALLALLFAFILTGSRGSFIGFSGVAFLILFMPVLPFSVPKRIIVAGVICLSFLAFMPGAINKVSTRIETLSTSNEVESSTYDLTSDSGVTLDSRVTLWRDGYTIAMISPVFGVGLGERRIQAVGYPLLVQGRISSTVDHAHSSYLNMWIQTGIIALILFIIVNATVLMTALVTVYKHRNNDLSMILALFAVGVMGFMVTMISQNTLFKGDAVTLYWVLLGTMCGLVGRIKYEEGRREIEEADA